MHDAKESDEDRLVRWVAEHGVALKGFLRASLRQPDLADDLVQETLCRAWEARHRYVDRGKERGYLLRIADRLACDANRRPRLLEVPETADRGGPIAAEQERRESPPNCRSRRSSCLTRSSALLLRYYSDLGFDEIATVMSCPINGLEPRAGLLTLRRLLVGVV